MSFAAPKTAASPLPDELNGSERWFKKNTQPPRFEDRYSGWLPKIPRVNHMTQMERVDHMANVAARRTRDMLYQLQVKSEADVRERRLRESGPGATHEVLDQTRKLKTLAFEGERKKAVKKDLRFIRESKMQRMRLGAPRCAKRILHYWYVLLQEVGQSYVILRAFIKREKAVL